MNNESSLENVFLKLCIKDQDQTNVVESASGHGLANPIYEKAQTNVPIDSKTVNKMHLNDDNDESVLPEVSTQNGSNKREIICVCFFEQQCTIFLHIFVLFKVQ